MQFSFLLFAVISAWNVHAFVRNHMTYRFDTTRKSQSFALAAISVCLIYIYSQIE